MSMSLTVYLVEVLLRWADVVASNIFDVVFNSSNLLFNKGSSLIMQLWHTHKC